ncbi:MAG: nicotinate-nucleotide--dimethylbenzimidazole phosphoribosyltransferase [Rhodospirillales bacterium]|nr:nicotinate-nucleotide--dimethylbenzimidazole phosphoribosyltransferase [Rhodospirillales bacterium]
MTEVSNLSNSTNTSSINFSEILKLLDDLPIVDLESTKTAQKHENKKAVSVGSFGRLDEIISWLSLWQGKYPPRIDHPRICIFAGNHGVTDQGITQYSSNMTAKMVQDCISGGAPVNQLAVLADADLRVYEMALEQPTQDFTQGPAMTEEECARAIAYGMLAVEDNIDLLVLGEMGIGNEISASAMCCVLLSENIEDWFGSEKQEKNTNITNTVEVIRAGIEVNKLLIRDPLNVLRCLGGQEIAAEVGAIIAARIAGTPVLLDGFVSTAAALVLHKINPELILHCCISHLSPVPAHSIILNALNKRPILELGISMSGAVGASVAINIIRASIACGTIVTDNN